MDNKEAINWLTRIRDRLMTTSSKQFEAMTIAIAALEKQEKDKWIPVKEKLPEKAGRYLVTARWNENMDYLVDTLDYGFKVNEDWHGTDYIFPNGGAFGEDWNGEIDNLEKDILAWMPLPEVFKGE